MQSVTIDQRVGGQDISRQNTERRRESKRGEKEKIREKVKERYQVGDRTNRKHWREKMKNNDRKMCLKLPTPKKSTCI